MMMGIANLKDPSQPWNPFHIEHDIELVSYGQQPLSSMGAGHQLVAGTHRERTWLLAWGHHHHHCQGPLP